MPEAPAEQPITVVVIDGHALFRAGLRELLAAAGIELVGEATSAEGGLQLVERHAPDVAIVDPALQGGEGIELIRAVAARTPRTRVLALTRPAARTDAVEVVLRGGSCCLLKEASVETIVAGVRAAAAGEAMISPRLAAGLLERLRTSAPQPRPAAADPVLSEREKQVLRLVVTGMDNDAIARELFISPHTVKNHISSILAKLDVSNRIEAAVQAVRGALV
jgi:DNA-binding NarL/FixJ family response regulator